MATKTEWISEHLGKPAEWQVDRDGVIRDTVRPFSEQIVGRITRKDGLAIVRWSVSGDTSTLPDWEDEPPMDGVDDALAQRRLDDQP